MEDYNAPGKRIIPENDPSNSAGSTGKRTANLNYQNMGLDSLMQADERIMGDEIGNIEFQIAEREKIKQKNLKFLEWQREKLEELVNRTKCFDYAAMGTNEIRNKLVTQLVQVELKKGDEYVTAFRDVQRLEEEKRKLLSEGAEDKGWLKY
jgi:hypothetical protein